MQGTSPKFKSSQLLYLSTYPNVIMCLLASGSSLQFMAFPSKNETDLPVTIKSCKKITVKTKIQLNYTSNFN